MRFYAHIQFELTYINLAIAAVVEGCGKVDVDADEGEDEDGEDVGL